jgi:hypothetical protein
VVVVFPSCQPPTMGTLLRRPVRTLCFFCQTSISPPPPHPLSFLCPHCACWNHYDANGVILSDDPAMHDETLNRRSFARRGASSLSCPLLPIHMSLSSAPAASPRKDRLLSTFGNAPFCSVCQSNQRLVNSLLSSYLPPSDDVRTPCPYAVLKAVKALTTCVPYRLFCRIPIMLLASQASRPTKLPSTRATHSSARGVPPSSKRRYEKRTTWRVRTRSDRG